VARVKAVQANGQDERSRRPYPSGGARHSLELYPLINHCQGVPAGLYYYAPDSHQLYHLSEHNALTDSLFEGAKRAADLRHWPQILILISARFQRVSWKYQSVAYALILKEVGVLYQTMYLVATAMNLAPCALGGGNSDLFAKAIKTNYYAETSVGEFILGSRA
jgi:SagB-type dehydrogenase family enzyme